MNNLNRRVDVDAFDDEDEVAAGFNEQEQEAQFSSRSQTVRSLLSRYANSFIHMSAVETLQERYGQSWKTLLWATQIQA